MKQSSKQNPKAAKPSVFGLLNPYKGTIALLLLFAVLANGVNLLIPKIISRSIDAFSSGHFSMKTLIVEFLVASLIIFVFTGLQSIAQVLASEKVARDLRKSLSDKISQQSYAFIQQSNPSKLLTNLTSDIDSIKMFVSQAVVIIVSSVFTIIGACVLMLFTNWKLALLIMAIVPIMGATFSIIFKKVKVFFKQSREIIDRLNRTINESIMGAALIRVINSQGIEFHKFTETNTDGRNIGLSIVKLFAWLIPVIWFVSNLAMLVILILGGHFVVMGSMSLGDFAAFNSYLGMLIFPIMMIGFMSNIIAQADASFQRINQVLEAPDVIESGTVEQTIAGDIEFKNVSLSLGGKPVLKNVSFSIKKGSRTAIIGPTAAGKSQLLYLLTSILKPDSGTIEVDSLNINNYKRDSYHNQIGFVFQDSVIFNLSLRDNIAFNDKVTNDMYAKALETAELTEFADSLPQKSDTIVAERGTSLSGGQKQRIMLARALAMNPKILLLDDFTARVDRKTEQKILCNLENNYPDLSLLSVTQKVSSVKHFEQIILLMEGEVIATGTHKELLETSTEYAQIYNSQRSTSHYEQSHDK